MDVTRWKGPSVLAIIEAVIAVVLVVVAIAIVVELTTAWDGLGSGDRAARLTSLASVAVGIVALIGLELARRGGERAERHQLTSLKSDLYVTFYVETDRHRQQVSDQIAWRRRVRRDPTDEGPRLETTEQAERALVALELTTVPESVLALAWTYFTKLQLFATKYKIDDDMSTWGSALDKTYEADLTELALAREAFREAAAWDLWEPREPTSRPIDSRNGSRKP